MNLYTIGFTQKSARQFFALLENNGVKRLIDTRSKPYGQLSGFSKKDDIAYFLDRLIGCEYHHLPELAPTTEILGDYRKDHDWVRYVNRFETLMDERQIPNALNKSLFTDMASCLLCSEATPEKCHRRLVGERLVRTWPELTLIHLV
jgi:uncharacterized protein (DUF488 family)